jgi:hypothetical protein
MSQQSQPSQLQISAPCALFATDCDACLRIGQNMLTYADFMMLTGCISKKSIATTGLATMAEFRAVSAHQ